MPRLFDLSFDFLGVFLSLEGFVKTGIALMAAVLLYLLSLKYSDSAKKISTKILPIFGFNDNESSTLAELASNLVKTAGIASVVVIIGKYVPLMDAFSNIGSFILTLLGWSVSLALPLAVIYLARKGLKP